MDQQVLSFIHEFNASNFFSTEPHIITAQHFYSENKQASIPTNMIKSRCIARNIPLESMNLSRSLQRLQEKLKQNPILKMNKCKQKLKQTKSIFMNELQLTHRKQTNRDELAHCTNILKNRFINLYETKKHRLNSEHILIKGKIQKQHTFRQSLQSIKLKKKLREDTLINFRKSQTLLKQELLRKSFLSKQEIKMKLNHTMSKDKQWRLQKAGEVIESMNRFVVRKSQLQRIRKMKSRFNYHLKANEEKQLIQEYENILTKIQNENPQNQNFKSFNFSTNRNLKKDDDSAVQFLTSVQGFMTDSGFSFGKQLKNRN